MKNYSSDNYIKCQNVNIDEQNSTSNKIQNYILIFESLNAKFNYSKINKYEF